MEIVRTISQIKIARSIDDAGCVGVLCGDGSIGHQALVEHARHGPPDNDARLVGAACLFSAHLAHCCAVRRRAAN